MTHPVPSAERRDQHATGIVTLRCRHGTLSFFRSDDPIGRALLEYGEWAEHEIELLLQLVREGDTVLDVGANVGTHTLALARAVGAKGKVLAFEPQGPVFELLRENAARNGLAMVDVRRAGVAGAPGEMRVPVVDYDARVNAGGVALVAADGPASGVTEPVPVVSLDSLDLTRCDLIKLDVEGMELEVLRGASQTIARCAPFLYAECNRIDSGWEVARLARELGYRVLLHRAKVFHERNYFANPVNTFGVAHETNLLLVPPARAADAARIAGSPDLDEIASLDDLARAMLNTPRWGDPDLRGVSPVEQAHQIARLMDAARAREERLAEAAATAVSREERIGRLQGELAAAERRLLQLATEAAARDALRARGPLKRAAARIRNRIRKLRGRRLPAGPSEAERLVAQSGLFDADYYRSRNPDLGSLAPGELLRHYVDHGAREGRDPCALFDSSYYLQTNPDVRAAGVNPLVHFLTDGATEGRRPNPLFEPRHYASHPQVAVSGLNPLHHYVRFGAADRLDPSPEFQTAAYLEEHPAESLGGLSPLAHALAAREAERGTLVDDQGLRHYRKAPLPTAPTREEWDAVLARRVAASCGARPLVDVVIPVYRGFDDTLRCVHSVLSARCRTPHALVVMNDASPDEALVRELERLAADGLLELVHNARNAGFVETCNRAMALHPDRDVVLLNSDTEVYGDWLDRIRAAAMRGMRVATVTPLSNSATICSYPFFPRDNDMALELAYEELDGLAARVNAGESIPLPTAVGFCMYVRRACLDEIGPFDLERFGRGYGEENDFCLRAAARGWTNVLATDVFVRHTGGVSFGPEKQARVEAALAKLDERYPDYLPSVNRFVDEDPPREARRRLDLARLERRAGARAMLFITHTWGGGIERHVADLAPRLESEGIPVLFLRPHRTQQHLGVLSHPAVWPTPNLGPLDLRHPEVVAAVLRRLGVAHVHVHSLVGFDQPRAAEWVPRLCRSLGVAYDFTVHDYAAICPRINLIDGSGVYCGEPRVEECRRCVRESGSPFGSVSVQRWRDAYEGLLRGARAVLAPGEDAADRIARHFPGLAPRVQAHLERPLAGPAPGGARAEQPARANGARRVAIIGAIGAHKGFEVLRDCARDAAERRLPLSFHLVGYSCDDAALTRFGNVTIVGKYEEAELATLLEEQRCDCAFFSSVWPETYSYTLSAAAAAGLHPVAFDLGVVAERIRAMGWGTLLPLTTEGAAVNDALLAMPLPPPPDPERVRASFACCESVVRDYYGLTF